MCLPGCSEQSLHIAAQNCFLEPLVCIASRDELLTNITFVPQTMEQTHDRWEVDLLIIIEFLAARVSCDVNVTDQVEVLFQATHDVTVHNLHVVNVKQHLHSLRAHTANDVGNERNVIALISRVPLHRVSIVAGVQMLQAECYTSLFSQSRYLLQARNAVLDALAS